MAKKLVKTVCVIDPETGERETYLAGSSPPAAVARQITNPAAWETPKKSAAVRGRSSSPAISPDADFGEGPFRDRTDAQLQALLEFLGISAEGRDEGIAALEVEGIDPDAPVVSATMGDTNVG